MVYSKDCETHTTNAKNDLFCGFEHRYYLL